MADAPAAPSGGSQMDQAKGLLDNPVMVLILSFFTCGIIPAWWLWTRAKDLNTGLAKQQVNPLLLVPGCICLPVFVYGAWLFAQGFHELKKQKQGATAKDEIILHTILLALVFPVGAYFIQQQWNEITGKKV
jgi:hypothetical protein